MKNFFLYFGWLLLVGLAIFLFRDQKTFFPKVSFQSGIFSENKGWDNLQGIFGEVSGGFSEIGQITKMMSLSKQVNKDVVLQKGEEGFYYDNDKVGFKFGFDPNYFENKEKIKVFDLITENLSVLAFEYETVNVIARTAIKENKEDTDSCALEYLEFFDKILVNENEFFCQEVTDTKNNFFAKECYLKTDNKCYEIYYEIILENKKIEDREDIKKWENIEDTVLKNLTLKIK